MNHDAIRQHSTDLDQLIGDYDLQVADNEQLRSMLADREAAQNLPPSGEPMPRADLAGWRLIWNEDFDVDAPLGAFPSVYVGKVDHYPPTYFDTSRNAGRPAATQGQYDAARTVAVSGSVLRKWLHSEYAGPSIPPRPKVCALLPVIPTTVASSKWRYQTYGRYAIRARVTSAMPGYKFAWLLWPQSDDSSIDGELDCPERNFDTLGSAGAFIHHAPAIPAPNQHGFAVSADLTQWHTFVTEWSPGLVRFLCDGVEFGRSTNRVPARPMRWVIQTETTVTSTPPSPSVQGIVEIDWAAVWAYAP